MTHQLQQLYIVFQAIVALCVGALKPGSHLWVKNKHKHKRQAYACAESVIYKPSHFCMCVCLAFVLVLTCISPVWTRLKSWRLLFQLSEVLLQESFQTSRLIIPGISRKKKKIEEFQEIQVLSGPLGFQILWETFLGFCTFNSWEPIGSCFWVPKNWYWVPVFEMKKKFLKTI